MRFFGTILYRVAAGLAGEARQAYAKPDSLSDANGELCSKVMS